MKKVKLTINTAMIRGGVFAAQRFAKIRKLNPGVELAYVGTAPNGDMHFQQWGNPTPFILPV